MCALAVQVEDAAAEARGLACLGSARARTGDHRRAAEALRRAADLFGALGEPAREADTRLALGSALLAMGRTEDAAETLAWCVRSGSWTSRWKALLILAEVAEQAGDFPLARSRCDEASSVLAQAGEATERESGALCAAGCAVRVDMAQGDFRRAAAAARECRASAEALADGDAFVHALLNLGVCAIYLGQWGEAHRELEDAIRHTRLRGDRRAEAVARSTYAMLLAEMCSTEPAIRHAKDALASAHALGDHGSELFAHMALCDSYYALERDDEAAYHGRQALAAAEALRMPLRQAECRIRLARLALHEANRDTADQELAAARQTARRLGARHLQGAAYALAAEIALHRMDLGAALSTADAALAIAEELGLEPLRWVALGLRARAACAEEPPRHDAALAATREAVTEMESARADLRAAGITDTLLEDRQRFETYALHEWLLTRLAGEKDAKQFSSTIAWPLRRSGRALAPSESVALRAS
jgi:tetratricopeptide (TPR) repeat protein